MGCDIHMMAEVKKDGVWKAVGPVFKDPLYNPDKPNSVYNMPTTFQPYTIRNANVYALLAGIKNYDNMKPIALPRGIPKDASQEYMKFTQNPFPDEAYDEIFDEGYSYSWITLQELLAVNWEKKILKNGYVDKTTYENYKKFHKPIHRYSRERLGSEDTFVTEMEYEKMNEEEKQKVEMIKIKWTSDLKTECSIFYPDTIDALKQLGNPEDVRILFFFTD